MASLEPYQGPTPDVAIVGGGTAGWMAANLMAARWPMSRVTLVESPDIGIIGVGEGSTPQVREFFDDLNIAESEWMPACNATYKLGIRFDGWSTKPGFPSYFHPFPAKVDAHTQKPFVLNCYARRQGLDVAVHPDQFFLNAYLAERALGPHPRHEFPFPVQYGYHFDSHLLGQYLAGLATARGVEHRQARITEVRQAESGDIAALVTDAGDQIEAGLFVDCTGFAGVLMQKTLGVKLRGFGANLFNDSAVVMPTPVPRNPKPQTVSIAMKHGWRWLIPLTNRTGNGYVYSSAYCSPDQAETELRTALDLLDADVEARHLKMRVGQLARHWDRNCLAVGLSQGFIEPLEATALHLVLVTIKSFIENFEKGGFTTRHQDDFNAAITRRFEGVRDYIVCHYRANSRTDTDYWKDNQINENLSLSLKGVLKTWLERGDLSLEIQEQRIAKYYTTISWHCLLAGYGLFPDAATLKQGDPGPDSPYDLAELKDFLDRCALNFTSHRANLDDLQKRGSG